VGEDLLVGVIVAVVLFLAVRSLYRTVMGKGGGCACAGGQCSARDEPSRGERTGATQGASRRTNCHSCCGGVFQEDIEKEKHA